MRVCDFKKSKEAGRLGVEKIVKTAKEYPHACERCGETIKKGTYCLSVEEKTGCNYCVRTEKTHRLCAKCTEEVLNIERTRSEAEQKENDVVRYDMGERVFDDVKEKLASVGFELLHLSSTERGKDFDVILLTTIVKHPLLKEEYVPFTGDELNELVGKLLVNKQSGRKKLVTGKPTASNGINLDGDYFSAKDLLANFTLNGNPCGRKV